MEDDGTMILNMNITIRMNKQMERHDLVSSGM